jgi:hypothetical protein
MTIKSFLYKTFLKAKEVLSMMSYSGVSVVPKPANRTFFFGYGSLMYPNGLNCRGMNKIYEKKDLKLANLKGFVRSLNARSWNGLLYYGLKEDGISHINGVIFEIYDDYDYTKLLISEGAHPAFGKSCVYKSIEVTDKIFDVNLPTDAKVFVVVPISPTNIGYLPVQYVKEVWDGVQFWGVIFLNEFLKTGGRKYDKKLIEDQVLYSRRTEEFLRKEYTYRNANKGTRKNTLKRGAKL